MRIGDDKVHYQSLQAKWLKVLPEKLWKGIACSARVKISMDFNSV